MANENMRENDLVLSPNEFAYVLDTTKGHVSAVVGPNKMSLSTSDRLVLFNEAIKTFVETSSIESAIQIFTTAPENWYVQLKNPTPDGEHPRISSSNTLPDLDIGRKINIVGPCSFALFPGQMAKVIPGHRMHSNQYLKARVYDADAVNGLRPVNPEGKLLTAEECEKIGKKTHEDYVVGQILIIKGTEVPFYIPPTGIEVLPIGGKGNEYVRNALTLKKLEYCILEDESGKRTYIHGPEVVFPRPDQTFVKNDDGGIIFNAIELSEISGIYVKVIEDYVDDKNVEHKSGEEMFITGKDTPIYYPREEHNIINYGDQVVHHAIAVPEGEGRYILNRKTGVVKTVRGPVMYLVNPINEVALKRYLTREQCELWYPGNREVLNHNLVNNNEDYEDDLLGDFNCNYNDSPARLTKSVHIPRGFSRGTSFTPPRTITLDTKFDGAVSISVRTGYAVNVISKSGHREVVVGPKTILLDYDQTLEVLELSTGKPKTTDYLDRQVYLRVENNKVSDIIHVETADFVQADIKVSYAVNFLEEYKDKWFSIENYVKFLCDRERSILKAIVKQYDVETFYANSTDIIRSALLGTWDLDDTNDSDDEVGDVSVVFEENGMQICDVDVLSIHLDDDVEGMIASQQEEIISKSLNLTLQKKSLTLKKELADIEKQKLLIDRELKLAELAKKKAVDEAVYATNIASIEAKAAADEIEQKEELEYQNRRKQISQAEIDTAKVKENFELEGIRQRNNIRQVERRSQTSQITDVLDKISPRLVAAMENNSNAMLVESITKNISPYALARDEKAVDVLSKLLHGMPIDGAIENILDKLARTDV